MTRKWIHWPRSINIALIAAGGLWMGGHLAVQAAHEQIGTTATTYVQGGIRTIVSTITEERKVRGRVIHVRDKVYVHVPLVIVHVDHRTIRVPAHRLPLTSASATIANPLVTVAVQVPTTVFLPGTTSPPITVTSTVTSIVTLPPITTTITVPLDSTDRSAG